MDPKLAARAREIFDAAVDLPRENRAAWLDRTCGGDGALRARVDALLASIDGAGDFRAAPTVGTVRFAAGPALAATVTAASVGGARPAGSDSGPLREGPGTRIGRYTLVEQIGEGGFGVVFRAEQHQPVRREVALKVIRLGM